MAESSMKIPTSSMEIPKSSMKNQMELNQIKVRYVPEPSKKRGEGAVQADLADRALMSIVKIIGMMYN